MSRRVIDVHHHIYPAVYMAKKARYPIIARSQGYLPASVLEWTPERSLAEMEKAGALKAIVSISTPGISFANSQEARALARECNEYAANSPANIPTALAFSPRYRFRIWTGV